MLTIIRCCGYEERQEALMAAQQAEEQSEQDYDDDMPDRIAGDCERCQEPQSDLLTMSGSQAICDDCTAAEEAANEDPR